MRVVKSRRKRFEFCVKSMGWTFLSLQVHAQLFSVNTSLFRLKTGVNVFIWNALMLTWWKKSNIYLCVCAISSDKRHWRSPTALRSALSGVMVPTFVPFFPLLSPSITSNLHRGVTTPPVRHRGLSSTQFVFSAHWSTVRALTSTALQFSFWLQKTWWISFSNEDRK